MIEALRVRGATFLLVTGLVGRLPQAMTALAIVRLVRDQGGDFASAAFLTALCVVAATVGQPILGRLLDRTGRPRAVLLSSAIASTIALVGLAYSAVSLPALGVMCAIVAGLATPPLESCLRSLWTSMMTPGEQLHSAFSVDAAAQEVLFVTGPLVTALGILIFGAQGNIVVMAALTITGTVLFSLHPLTARRAVVEPEHNTTGSPLGLASFRRLVGFQLAIGFPIGVLTISATTFAEVVEIPALAAWALSVNSLGALTGAILIGRRPLTRPPHVVIRRFGALLALLYLGTALATLPVALWLCTAFIAGVMLPIVLTQVFHQTERSVPKSQLNEANSWVISAFTLGVAGGTLLAGVIVGPTPTGWGIAIGVTLGSAIALIGSLTASPKALARDTVTRLATPSLPSDGTGASTTAV